MNKKIGFLLQSTALVLALSLSACGPQKKAKYDPNKFLTDQQKNDQKEKTEQDIQKRKAYNSGVYVKYNSIRFVAITDSKIAIRLGLELNGKDRNFLVSTPIEKVDEQFDIQDRTTEIEKQFPNQNFEISTYRFKSGTVEMMAFELRFLKVTTSTTLSGSQFVLAVLNKELGNKAVLKTQFEYPSKTDLKTWAKAANAAAMGTP